MFNEKAIMAKRLCGKRLSRREENMLELMQEYGLWKRVYICAPYDGENTRSREKIWGYCLFARERTYAPIAPFLYYPQFMPEFYEKEMQLMRSFALRDLLTCEEVWVFGNEVTPEMEREVSCASSHGINVRFLPDYEEMIRMDPKPKIDEGTADE